MTKRYWPRYIVVYRKGSISEVYIPNMKSLSANVMAKDKVVYIKAKVKQGHNVTDLETSLSIERTFV